MGILVDKALAERGLVASLNVVATITPQGKVVVVVGEITSSVASPAAHTPLDGIHELTLCSLVVRMGR